MHVIETFEAQADGVAGIVRLLSEQLAKDMDITIVTSSPESRFPETEYRIYPIHLPMGIAPLRGVTRTRREFSNIVEKGQPNVIHIHGVFSPLQRITLRVAKEKGISTLLSAHGMLEPWMWKQNGLLYHAMKRAFWRFIIYPTLSKTDYVHVITPGEAKTLAKEFHHHPQFQIPNVIDFSTINLPSTQIEPDNIFVFLGRLHPVKGINLLIQAFKHARLAENWQLLIAGPDFSPAYGQELRQLTANLGLADQVKFIGPVYGSEKFTLLSRAWAVVVPSYSEVIALVNLEAAAVNTPTITTTDTGLHDWAESGGILINVDVDQLSQALQNASSWTSEDRQRRGLQARNFVQARYSWQTIRPRWVDTYQKIAHGERA